MMEHISLIKRNKKGVSMVELIAYVALYGVVMSLLASLVFVIVQAARKVNRQAILNRGSILMYTEILSQTISLNPDTVSDVYYFKVDVTKDNYNSCFDDSGKVKAEAVVADPENNKTSIKSVAITFTKKYDYYKQGDTIPSGKSEGDRYEIVDPSSITYILYKKDSAPAGKKSDCIYVINNGTESTISLDYGMTISSAETDDNIFDCIQVDKQNNSNKYVTFNGFLHFDNRTMEFNFIIPVYVANVS